MSKKKTTKTEPWKAAQPYILDSLKQTQNTVRDQQGNLNGLTGGLNTSFKGLVDKVNAPNPLLEQGQQFASDTMNGDYLNSNPHMEGMLKNTSDNVTNSINSAFSRSSQANSSRHSQILAQELAKAQNDIQFGQYNQERANQMGAMGMVPGLNEAQYSGYNLLPGMAGSAAQIPYTGVNTQAQNVSGLTAPYSTTTQKDGFGVTLMNAAMAAAQTAAMASDSRLKTNIEKVGQLDDGLGVYEYDYIADMPDEVRAYCPEGRQRGVMADEVATIRPWALGPLVAGFKTVKYGAL